MSFIWVVAFIALLTIDPAGGASCDSVADIVESAKTLTKNTALGGHLAIHVQVHDPNDSPQTVYHKKKGMFKKFSDFTTLWGYWKGTTNKPKARCDASANVGVFNWDCYNPHSTVKKFYYNDCDSVHNNKCKLSKPYLLKSVKFFYKVVAPKGTKNYAHWVLLSAYPYPKENCKI